MEMMESRRYYRGCVRGVSMDSRAFYIVLFFNVFFCQKNANSNVLRSERSERSERSGRTTSSKYSLT